MKKDKRILIGVSVSFALVIAVAIATNSDSVYGITGFFTKAFDKSLSAGEYYEHNITVRKYYNISIRFQKEGSTGYLGFTDNDSVVVLKDANGGEVLRAIGVDKGKIYTVVDASQVQAIATASAYSISDYADVADQSVNVSYSGSNAYVTIIVTYREAMITGYVIDDLTGDFVSNVGVLAFDDGADPYIVTAVVQNVSDTSGRYQLSLQLNSSKALDVYVEGYDVG